MHDGRVVLVSRVHVASSLLAIRVLAHQILDGTLYLLQAEVAFFFLFVHIAIFLFEVATRLLEVHYIVFYCLAGLRLVRMLCLDMFEHASSRVHFTVKVLKCSTRELRLLLDSALQLPLLCHLDHVKLDDLAELLLLQ